MGKRKYIFTPEMDKQIRELYQNEVGIKAVAYAGPVKALAKKFRMPRHAVSKRARELTILPLQKKEPNWQPRELAILERNAHLTPPVVQRHLKRAGFHRSQQGITMKRGRLHLSRTSMDGYTVRSLAECFGIDAHSVIRWIAKGWLKARRRGTARTRRQGGDEWYITELWVTNFVIESVAVIDFRKVDKYWLVGLLAGDRLVPRHSHCTPDIKYISDEDDRDLDEVDLEVLEIFAEAQEIF